MEAIFTVIWKNKEVGWVKNPIYDMWYLEGAWSPTNTPDSREFEALISTLNPQQVMRDLTKGVDLTLKDNDAVESPVIGITLYDGKLFVRRRMGKNTQ